MWNYYKTVVVNSGTTEEDKPVFFTTDSYISGKLVENGLVNVWGNGQYELSKIGAITKTNPVTGKKQIFTLTCGALEAGSYLLTIKVEMDGKFLGDYASPLHDFYKPIVVGFSISEGATAAQVAEIIAEKIKLAIPDNNKFINVENTKGNAVITVTLTDYYMFVKKENVVLQKLVLPACGETCIGEYEEVEGVTFNETQKAQQPFATGTWLIENQRIPNSSNFRYFGLNGEMPIANAKYVQYTFDYAQDRPGLGGHSGVGQNITAITNHTFFVIDSAAKSFETAFAGAKGGFAGDALEE